jgi:hypothetical protein
MSWIVLWIVVLLIGALGVVASVNSLRFRRGVARDVRRLWAGAAASNRTELRPMQDLPPPVQRYLAKALRGRSRAVRTVRLRHGGTFRPRLDGGWLSIRGAEYFSAEPPGFVWWGRVRLAPGLWIEARDRSIQGAGSMLVSAESTFTIANTEGPAMDQGALLRLLGEMPWFPTALLDDRHVSWTGVDASRARATLRVGGREVTGEFEFGGDGLPVAFRADRHRDVGGGRSVLTQWSGDYGDYRDMDGLLVPFQAGASWQVDGQPVPYARFLVDRLDVDVNAPF